jgi:hypothetical protein
LAGRFTTYSERLVNLSLHAENSRQVSGTMLTIESEGIRNDAPHQHGVRADPIGTLSIVPPYSTERFWGATLITQQKRLSAVSPSPIVFLRLPVVLDFLVARFSGLWKAV